MFRRRKSGQRTSPRSETEVRTSSTRSSTPTTRTTSDDRCGRRRRRPLARSVRRVRGARRRPRRASTSAACGSPGVEGMELRLEVDEEADQTSSPSRSSPATPPCSSRRSRRRAPTGIWDDVRGEIRANLAGSGLVDEVNGPFGRELHATLTVQRRRTASRSMQPVRFVGVDGPRWFLRGLFSGARGPRERRGRAARGRRCARASSCAAATRWRRATRSRCTCRARCPRAWPAAATTPDEQRAGPSYAAAPARARPGDHRDPLSVRQASPRRAPARRDRGRSSPRGDDAGARTWARRTPTPARRRRDAAGRRRAADHGRGDAGAPQLVDARGRLVPAAQSTAISVGSS